MRYIYSLFSSIILITFCFILTACSTLGYQADKKQDIKRYEIVLDPELQEKFSASGPSLLIYPIKTSAAYKTSQIRYRLQQYDVAYYAKSEWADTPAKMLLPILIGSMENSGLFQSVINASSAAITDLALDAELLDLTHVYSDTKSEMVLSIRLQLIDLNQRKILGTDILQFKEPAPSNDPYGAVVALNAISKQLINATQKFVQGLL